MGNSTSTWESITSERKQIELHPHVTKFDNLKANHIEKIWRSFSSKADSCAVTKEQLLKHLSCLRQWVLGGPGDIQSPEAKAAYELHVTNLFTHWTTSLNEEAKKANPTPDSIDFMELFNALVLTAKMSFEEKVEYLWQNLDLDCDNDIDLNEVTLGIKSIEGGISKMRGDVPAPERRIIDMSTEWFGYLQSFDPATPKVDFDSFISFCESAKHPALVIIQLYADAEGSIDVDSDVEREGNPNDNDCVEMDDGMDDIRGEDAEAELMAVKPYIKAIKEPSWYNHPLNPEGPPSSLNLDVIHGYRAFDCRNNVKFLVGGHQCMYFAAGVVIKCDVDTGKQYFYMEHTNDVMSMAVSRDVNGIQYVASGEIGAEPTINIFDAKTMQTVVSVKGFHKRGVHLLAFSKDGDNLFSVGLDDDHSIAVYSTKDGKLLASGKGNKQKVLHAVGSSFKNSDFCTVGVKHIDRWEVSSGSIKSTSIFWGEGDPQNGMCAAFTDEKTIVVGTAKGDVFTFREGQYKEHVPTHDGAVNSLEVHPGGKIITGGKDGQVHIWEAGIKAKSTSIDMKHYATADQCHSTVVRAICIDVDLKSLCVGTQSSSLFHLNVSNAAAADPAAAKLLTAGHNRGELWGIATHPTKLEYATVGDDMVLRIWDVATKNLRKAPCSVELKSMARVVAYSADGTKIAVGLGGGDKKDKAEGSFRVFNEEDLSVLHESKDCKQFVTDIKFSPDGKLMAVGGRDNSVFLYDVLSHFKKKAKFNKHNSHITHLDFSADSEYLQSTCGGLELLYSEVSKGQQIHNMKYIRDFEWDTWTLPFGWPVQGIWGSDSSGGDVNAVCRSKNGKTLAVTDDMGLVKLYAFPCVHNNATGTEYRGHSSHVTNCRFTAGDAQLITTGGGDNCIFQWIHDVDEDDEAEDADIPDEFSGGVTRAVEKEEDEFGDERGGGDEFMAVKPWVGAIKDPTGPPDDVKDKMTTTMYEDLMAFSTCQNSLPLGRGKVPDDLHAKTLEAQAKARTAVNKARRGKEARDMGTPEDNDLNLHWVHGFSSQGDNRANVKYTAAGKIVYYAAGLGIIFDPEAKTQKFVYGHDDDITAMAMHPDGKIVATGQMGKKPTIVVWDSETGENLARIQGFFRRGILRLDFSTDGTTLIGVGNDDDHSIALYDWKSNKCKASSKGDKAKILDVKFVPNSTNEFVTVGVKHIKYWTIQGTNIAGKKGILGKEGKNQPFPCCAFMNNNLVVGCADGSIYTLVDRKVKTVTKMHLKAVNTMITTPDNTLITGSKDGKVFFFDTTMNPLKSIFCQALMGDISVRPFIRSVSLRPDKARIVIGTEGSEIVEFDVEAGAMVGPCALINGHFKDELWGCAANPIKGEFATVGDDATLRVWNAKGNCLREANGMKKLNGMARACHYSPDGLKIAVGMGGSVGKGRQKCDGEVKVFDAVTLKLIWEGRDSKEWIEDLKFSPDGKTLAVGSHDNAIYFYDVNKDYKMRARFKAHNSFITHLDFSKDSQFLQSNCGAYELLFCDVLTGKQIKSATDMRDVEWATNSCILGWGVQGIWGAGMDGSDINAAVRSGAGSVVVTTADDGLIRLYNWPCVDKKAQCEVGRGHSSHVANACWTCYDEFLVTAGGGDRCVFVWKHVIECDGEIVRVEAEAEEIVYTTKGGGGDDEEEFEERGGGDEFMAVKPYVGAIKEPSNPPPNNPAKPECTLELEHVFGYNGCGTRYGANNEIVFSVAALGMQLTADGNGKWNQAYCQGHDDDIESFAISKDRAFFATGQMGKPCYVKVWDAATCLELATLKSDLLKRGIPAVSFSEDGTQICVVGNDDDHQHVVFTDKGGRWSKVEQTADGKGDKAKVLWCIHDGKQFVSGGFKFVKWFNMEGKNLKAKKGTFGKEKATIIPSGCVVGGNVYTSTADGAVYKFQGTKVAKGAVVTEGEKNACYCVAPNAAGDGLIAGSKDGNMILLDLELTKTAYIQVGHGPIRSIDAKDNILLGCAEEIVEVDIEGSMIGTEPVMWTHSTGEVWGLGTLPGNDWFVSAGDDKKLKVWSVKEKRMLGGFDMPDMSRCLDMRADGMILAGLGGEHGRGKGKKNKKGKTMDGGYALLKMDLESLEIKMLKASMMCAEWVSDVKFGPNDQMGVGSHDNKVYVYKVEGEDAKKTGVCKKHNSYITHFDFSKDGKFIQSNCGGYELLFYGTEDCKQITSASSMKDVEWDTWSCILGWPVQEIWEGNMDGTDVNAVSVRGDKKYMALSDDFGQVRVYNYPVVTKGAKYVVGVGHSSHVTCVRWLTDETLVTSGGGDKSVIVWKVKEGG
ncbi:hypothetical protein TrVE_jg371 [Triparma verrucosa]|uniref:EF-hand domain-containing protein n=1 Tax=Triparma verrucosa TaxID=1606542 RepID=A0A9W7DKS2_9STRA|nr:hypothetical protein TrVE_jg371 [Triparma verrucosa]